MDLHHIESIVQIAEEKSITKAAEKLFITQSALNQQLQKLEAELGAPIFIRNRSDWRPTEAGAAYLEAAHAMIQMKKDTYSLIQDIAQIQKRQITIGLIPERGINMFTSIYPEFHRRYPKALLEPIETNVRSMQKQISAGNIQLGLITLMESQKDDNTYFHMTEEEIFLIAPATHPLAHLGSINPGEAPAIPLSRFSGDPFVRIFQTSTMHALEQQLFEAAGFEPHVLFSTSSNMSKHRMAATGIGCALIPAFFSVPDKAVRFFRPDTKPHWEVTICCRKDAYLSKAEEAFLGCCREYWNKVSLSPL